MRNLNECQAEIFRRSENRIKMRKQRRKHVVMTCLPLVLCVSVLSAFMLLGGKQNMMETTGTSNMLQSAGAAVKVEVSNRNGTRTYTDIETVTAVYTQVSDCKHTGSITTESAGGTVPEMQEEITPGLTGTVTGGQGSRIVITLQDGSKLSFDLMGRVLTQKDTNDTYTLTDAQYWSLAELLQIE